MKIKVDGHQYDVLVPAGTNPRDWLTGRLQAPSAPTWETLTGGGTLWVDWSKVSTVAFDFTEPVDALKELGVEHVFEEIRQRAQANRRLLET